MTATHAGSKNGWSDARTATWFALGDAVAVALGRRDREADLDLAAVELARDVEAGVAEDDEHLAVLGQHLGDELLDARPPRASSASCSSRRVPMPRPWKSSATVKATSAARRSRSRTKFASATMRPSRQPIERAALVPVGIEERRDELRRRGAGKPWKRR